jgi:Flp pilus assembly pilin Flp
MSERLVEYSLILTLITIVVIAILNCIGSP